MKTSFFHAYKFGHLSWFGTVTYKQTRVHDPRSTVYDIVAKYTALEQFNESSSMPARKSLERTHREDSRSH